MFTVIDLIEVGVLASGKLPDIWWEMDLKMSEMRVLNYVWNNCLRLYTTIRVFPRGYDGSPRFWRYKEKMAEDVGLAPSTFRQAVRSLAEHGLVTSMDGNPEDECCYCIGLAQGWLDQLFSPMLTVENQRCEEKSFKQQEKALKHILYTIYNNLTTKLVSIKPSDNFHFFSKEKKENYQKGFAHKKSCKNSETVSLDYTSAQNIQRDEIQDSGSKTERIPIFISVNTRLPIRCDRKPITSTALIILQSKQMLSTLTHIQSYREYSILNLVSYYEYRCRQAINSSGYRALGKDFRNHKNWPQFTKLYQLCLDNGWDYRTYIDAQFDRAKGWARRQPYPYPNQFTSEAAQNYYRQYLEDYRQKYSVDGSAKVKTMKIQSVKQEIADSVVRDCDQISAYIQSAIKRPQNKGLSESELKMIFVTDHWMSLSRYYLATIPWFALWLEQLPAEPYITELREALTNIQSNNKMLKITNLMVSKVETQMGIPETLVFS